MWTYEAEWQPPFIPGWKTSNRRFPTMVEAAEAMAKWACVSAENGALMAVRLKQIADE